MNTLAELLIIGVLVVAWLELRQQAMIIRLYRDKLKQAHSFLWERDIGHDDPVGKLRKEWVI